MKTIIYLKSETHGSQVTAYNPNNLTSINVYRQEDVNTYRYDDIDDFNDSLKRDLSDIFEISDRETFNKMLIDFTVNMNLITKEL
jgi:hypothetical protein